MIGMEDLTIGVSTPGMESYVDALRAELLVGVGTKLNTSVTNIKTTLKTGWQGISEERFEKHLDDEVELIKSDLSAEFNDLMARLQELTKMYFDEDEQLISE